MTYRLPPLSVLRTFEAAARHLSFKKAAEEIHVTPAAVSQQIKALEDYLGLPLFRRLTRALELTPHGAAMLPKIREGFDCLAAAVEATRQASSNALTVIAPPFFASHWLIPHLGGFSRAHPEVELRLTTNADTIDRPGEALSAVTLDVREGRNELSIRYGTGSYPGFRVDSLFAPDYVPACAPALLQSRPLQAPRDLAHHVLIHDETLHDGERQPGWEDWMRAAGVTEVDGRRGLRFSNAELAVKAAVDGHGVVLALKPLVAADVAAGRLAIPLDFSVPSPYAYYLLASPALIGRGPVAAFRDWLLTEVGKPAA